MTMSSTVLRQLLSLVRFVWPPALEGTGADVYGGALQKLDLAQPYPVVPPTGPKGWLSFVGIWDGWRDRDSMPADRRNLLGKVEAARKKVGLLEDYPKRDGTEAKEALRRLLEELDAARQQFEGVSLVRQFPLRVPDGYPECFIVFLEALRLIAMPPPSAPDGGGDAGAQPAGLGWMGRGWLPRGYFHDTRMASRHRQDGSRANRAFRTSFFSAYCHVLLSVLQKKSPRQFQAFLRDPAAVLEADGSETGRMLAAQARMYVGSRPFEDLARLGADGRLGLDALRNLEGQNLRGRPRNVVSPPRDYRLPPMARALVLFSPVLAGDGRQFAVAEGLTAPLAEVLAGAGRFAAAEAIVGDDARGTVEVEFDRHGHSSMPQHSSLALASTCVALERLIMNSGNDGQEAAAGRAAAAAAPDAGAQPDAAPYLEAGRAALLHAMKATPARALPCAPAAKADDGPRDRFKGPLPPGPPGSAPGADAPALSFTRLPNGWTMDFPQGRWLPFECEQERSDLALAPRGSVWLPIPHALRQLPLTVEVLALRTAADGQGAALQPLDYVIADAIEPAQGIAYWLCPEHDDDPALPPSAAAGSSVVRALACRIGKGADAQLLVLIGLADPQAAAS